MAKDYQNRGRSSLAGQLLTFAATGEPLGHAERAFGWGQQDGDLQQFQWILEGGQGPMLLRAAQSCIERVPLPWLQMLTSADLTARIWHAERIETTLDIVEACEHQAVAVILLKGISVSEEWYPAEHLRPMGDIDALVPREVYDAVERSLLDRGYCRIDGWDAPPGLHHGAPLCHPRLDTIIELHTDLFPAGSELVASGAFRPDKIVGQSIASQYHGRDVRRLRPEAQLAYIAASWFNDIIHCKPQPSFLPSAFDAAYLLAATQRTLDWDALLEWLDNEMAQASLYAMLTYLPRYGLAPVPRTVLATLAASQSLVGPIQLRMIHFMLDRYLFGARPWNHLLPPPVPARYSLGYQFRKRIVNRFRAAV